MEFGRKSGRGPALEGAGAEYVRGETAEKIKAAERAIWYGIEIYGVDKAMERSGDGMLTLTKFVRLCVRELEAIFGGRI